MSATAPSYESPTPSLERDAIGLPEVLFQSITHMAPAVATALSIGAATSFAGGITPLAVLFAMIAVLFTAFSMAELARHLPSAGGMYTYVGRGSNRSSDGSWPGASPSQSRSSCRSCSAASGSTAPSSCRHTSASISSSPGSRSPSCAASSCGG